MTTADAAVATVQIDNNQVRVTQWDFAPGTQTGPHTHEYDYVVVPLTAGTLQVHSPEGVIDNALAPGASYQRAAGVSHNVVNGSADHCSFVEIELKRP